MINSSIANLIKNLLDSPELLRTLSFQQIMQQKFHLPCYSPYQDATMIDKLYILDAPEGSSGCSQNYAAKCTLW